MQTKVSVFMIAVLTCLCLSGCGSNSGGSSDNTSAPKTTVITSIEDMLSVEDFPGSFDYEYVFETDCQSDLEQYAGKVCMSDGYYTLEYEYFGEPVQNYTFLKYYDYATEQLVYVCGKSNCKHHDSSCDAYFDPTQFPLSYLWYYKGYLYMPMIDEDYVCMCKISLDGSTRENVRKIFRLDVRTEDNEDGGVTTSTYYPFLQVHRGYIYYSTAVNGYGLGEFGRLPLSGTSEAEIICTIEINESSDSMIYRIKPYGKYVFFQIDYNTDSEYGGNLYVYDTETSDSMKKVCDDCFRDYTLLNNKIYYFDVDEDICVYDVNSGEAGLFFDLDTGNDYTFMFNSRIFAYDDCLVYEITDLENYEYDEETDTVYTYVYQLVINQDGEPVQTLQPDDEKISPY